MAYKIHKISPTDLLAFCRSIETYSPALKSVFNPRIEREAPITADGHDISAKRKPLPDNPAESPSKRHCNLSDNMAAQALMSLMQSTERTCTPPPPVALQSPSDNVTLPPIQSIMPGGQEPSAPAPVKKEPSVRVSASTSVSAGSFASAKQCKTRKAAPSRVAIPASSGAKTKKQDKESSSEDDAAQSSRSTASPVSVSGRAGTPPSPAEESGAAHNKYCHFCQHVKVKRASSMISCDNRGCNRRFCDYCLNTHVQDPARADGNWNCPICRKTCCCTMRECTKNHRHCKAYRYRRKRAAQTDPDVPSVSAFPAVGGAGMYMMLGGVPGHGVMRRR